MIAALFVRGPGWDDTQPIIVAQEAFPGHLEWVHERRDGPFATVVEARTRRPSRRPPPRPLAAILRYAP